ncbi:uncharacterized protein MYU51_020427 [Penicillium brevicompactum]
MQVRRLLVSNSRRFSFPPAIFLSLLTFYFSFRVNTLEVDSLNHTGHSVFRDYTDRSRVGSEATSLLNIAVLDTPLGDVTYHSHFCVAFRTSDENHWLKFTLEPSPTIVSNPGQVTHVQADGTTRSIRAIKRSEISAFQGSVRVDGTGNGWNIVGWARVHFWKDGRDLLFEGTYSVQEVIHDIKVRVAGIGNTCQSDCTFGEPGQIYSYSASGSYRPSRPSPPAQRSNTNAERCIATDCSYTALFNSVGDVVRNVVGMINSASEVFERSFNITLRLSDLEVSEGTCPTPQQDAKDWNMPCSNGSLLDRLGNFSIWRATRADENAFWTLITGCSGAGIGVAWVGQLCNTDYDQSHGTGANVVVGMGQAWQIFAHEAGHTLGAIICMLRVLENDMQRRREIPYDSCFHPTDE